MASSNALREKRIIVYNHIFKTAGSMMDIILRQQYKSVYHHHIPGDLEAYHRLRYKKYINSDVSVIIGHILYDYTLLKKWDMGNMIFITMLRNPIKRLLSNYYYQAYNNIDMHTHISRKQIKPFIEWSRQPHLQNYMIRYLLGKWLGSITYEDYQKAKTRLEEDYVFVGITEKFDESLYMMYRHLSWSKLPYYANKANASSKPLSIKEPTEEELNAIIELNELDIELYEYFRGKLEKDISELSTATKLDMERFLFNQSEIANKTSNKDINNAFWQLDFHGNKMDGQIGVYIFGTGQGGQALFKFLREESRILEMNYVVKGFFDNNPRKHGTKFEDVFIMSPTKDIIGPDDYIIIASLNYQEDMYRQLLDIGIVETKILQSSILLQELLIGNDDAQTHDKKNKLVLNREDSESALISYYEKRIVDHLSKLGNQLENISVGVFASGEQEQLIQKALNNINIDKPYWNIKKDEFSQCVDIYIIGLHAEGWNRYVETLLSEGQDVDSFIFMN